MKEVAFAVFSQLQWDSFNSRVSFQCPAEYREEMERSGDSSSGEPKAVPTKRALISLHKKVIFSVQRDIKRDNVHI